MTTITSTFLKHKCELLNQICFFHKSGICQCIGMCTQYTAIQLENLLRHGLKSSATVKERQWDGIIRFQRLQSDRKTSIKRPPTIRWVSQVKPDHNGFAFTTKIKWFSLVLYRTPRTWLLCFPHQCDRQHVLLISWAMLFLANRKKRLLFFRVKSIVKNITENEMLFTINMRPFISYLLCAMK